MQLFFCLHYGLERVRNAIRAAGKGDGGLPTASRKTLGKVWFKNVVRLVVELAPTWGKSGCRMKLEFRFTEQSLSESLVKCATVQAACKPPKSSIPIIAILAPFADTPDHLKTR
jgi:hypothetical protein